jgi:hypothetical protein
MNFKPVTFFTDKTPAKNRITIAAAEKRDENDRLLTFKKLNVGDSVVTKVEGKGYDQFGKIPSGSIGTIKSFPPYVTGRNTYFVLVEFHSLQKEYTTFSGKKYMQIPRAAYDADEVEKENKITAAASEEKKDEKKEAPKTKNFNISFNGDIVVTNSKGEEVLKLNAADLSPEDIDKLKASDIKSLAEKFTKIKELGLTIENTNLSGLGESSLPDIDEKGKEPQTLEELAGEAPKDDKPLKPWASNKLKSIAAKIGSIPNVTNGIDKKSVVISAIEHAADLAFFNDNPTDLNDAKSAAIDGINDGTARGSIINNNDVVQIWVVSGDDSYHFTVK